MTSECGEHQKRIARSFLGDLTEAEQRSLEDHLSMCSLCRSEHAGYAQTLDLLQSSVDEPAPRHFFVHPQERESNPWRVFCAMKPRWQAVTAAVAGLLILTSIAAISRVRIQTVPGGWSMSFGKGAVDIAALKEEILRAVEKRNREAAIAWTQEMRAEIARSRTRLSQEQKADLAAAFDRIDSRFTERAVQFEDRLKADTQRFAAGFYQTVAQQRAQDLNLINTRFDAVEAAGVMETKQTNDILDTLLQLQVAEIKLR